YGRRARARTGHGPGTGRSARRACDRRRSARASRMVAPRPAGAARPAARPRSAAPASSLGPAAVGELAEIVERRRVRNDLAARRNGGELTGLALLRLDLLD